MFARPDGDGIQHVGAAVLPRALVQGSLVVSVAACAAAVAVGLLTVVVPAHSEWVIPACLLAILLIAQATPTQVMGCYVATAFAPGLSFDLSGFAIRPEHVGAVALILSLLRHGRVDHLVAAVRYPAVGYLGALVAFGPLVSWLFAPDFARSLSIVGWLGLTWLGLVGVVATISSSVRAERGFLLGAGAAALVSLALYAAHLAGVSDVGVDREQLTGAWALKGLFSEQNLLGGSMALWGAFAVFRARAGVMPVWASYSVAGLCFVVVVLSLTRAALVGVIVGGLVFLILSRSGRRGAVILFATMVLALVAAAVVAPTASRSVADKYGPSQLFNADSGTGAYRSVVVATALRDLEGLRWLHGNGVNSYGQRHAEQFVAGETGYLPVLPLQILYDYGILGLLLIGGAVLALRPLVRRRRAAALGLLALYLCTSAATSSFWFANTWLMIALASASVRPARSSS